MYKFFLSLTLSAMLFGCSSEPQSTQASAQQAAEQPASSTSTSKTLDAGLYVSPLPDDAPEFKVTTEANYPPYEFKNETGKVVGFDIDLIRAIGEKQGFKVNVINDPWQELFTNLEQKKRDIVVAGLGYNEERARKYAVSNPYAYSSTTIAYVSDEFSINSLDDLEGKKVGVLADSTISEFFSQPKFKIAEMKEYNTLFLAIRAMLRNEIDAVINDSAVMSYTLKQLQENNNFTSKFFEYDEGFSQDATVIYVVRKEDTELLEKINQGIDAVVADGTYAKIAEKWLGKNASDKFLQQHAHLKNQ